MTGTITANHGSKRVTLTVKLDRPTSYWIDEIIQELEGMVNIQKIDAHHCPTQLTICIIRKYKTQAATFEFCKTILQKIKEKSEHIKSQYPEINETITV